MLANLVANALRHTPDGGRVEIVGAAVDGRVELSVTDGCGGIAADDLERVFDIAWTGSSARTPDASGDGSTRAGLGLAIVKGIVEAHDGEVSVHNVDPAGCRFLVRLPRSV